MTDTQREEMKRMARYLAPNDVNEQYLLRGLSYVELLALYETRLLVESNPD